MEIDLGVVDCFALAEDQLCWIYGFYWQLIQLVGLNTLFLANDKTNSRSTCCIECSRTGYFRLIPDTEAHAETIE